MAGGRWGVLKFVACLWVLLFLNNRPIVHYCGWRKVGVRGVTILIIFCGSRECMYEIVSFKDETYLNKCSELISKCGHVIKYQLSNYK